jgi:hypothetical protein
MNGGYSDVLAAKSVVPLPSWLIDLFMAAVPMHVYPSPYFSSKSDLQISEIDSKLVSTSMNKTRRSRGYSTSHVICELVTIFVFRISQIRGMVPAP